MCSHCSRLRQECYYADEPHRSDGFAAARPSVARSEAAGSPALVCDLFSRILHLLTLTLIGRSLEICGGSIGRGCF